MRKYELINDGWTFEKEGVKSTVNLPHTWNALDGQGAEPTYYRGDCVYTRKIGRYSGIVYLEFKGVNSCCDIFVNDKRVGSHSGGYSSFRFNITDYLTLNENILCVEVDNSNSRYIYPETADFTFYGGIYRDVNIIYDVDDVHFSLDDCGSDGIYVTPEINGDIHVKALITGYKNDTEIRYEVSDSDGKTVASCSDREPLHVDSPVLWAGVENPYLYTLKATLKYNGTVADEVSVRFGIREIRFDADKGCFLNGKHIKLRGVARHQDRLGIGNAITFKEHAEDIALIKEVGANSVRLAHYEQSQDFYFLCDEAGLLVWAEVPVISKFSKSKQKNALSQLEELIKQSMNHPSIFCWGIENEITIQGRSKALMPALTELNGLAKKLDPSRPTTCAQLSMLSEKSELNRITDILGYNHYFGWYMKTCDGFDEWLPKFRAAQPDRPLCISEYGAEAVIGYFSDNPVQGDYSEGYQSLYHEHYIKKINSTEWLWGSYVWNMFEFGSSMRNEGGVRGRNNKGLVTFDRKTKKDAFYVYKAFWSDEKFIHIEGERYRYRTIGSHSFRVAANCDEITLVCGDYRKTLAGERIYTFENVPIKAGENTVTVTGEGLTESAVFEGVESYPREYSLPDGASSMVRNWFQPKDSENDPEYFSVDDRVCDILANEEIQGMVSGFAGRLISSPLIKPLTRFKLKTLMNIKILGLNDDMKELAQQYLQTVKKEK